MPKDKKGKILHPNSRKAKLLIRDQIHHEARIKKRIDAKHARSKEFEIVKFVQQSIKDDDNSVYSYNDGIIFVI